MQVKVNGLKLPDAYMRAWKKGGYWRLADDLQPGLSAWPRRFSRFQDADAPAGATADMAQWFLPETRRFANGRVFWSLDPGFIPYLTDCSQVVRILIGEREYPICLDFREDPQTPSVIHWAGAYWRRLAPSIEAFWAHYLPDHVWNNPVDRIPSPLERLAAQAIIRLVSEVVQYDTAEVLIHVLYSDKEEPVAIALPRAPRLSSAEGPVADWAITVTVPRPSSTTIKDPDASVEVRGQLEPLDPNSPRRMWGRAALAVVEHIVRVSGTISTPFAFRTARMSSGYFVGMWFPPEHSTFMYRVSENLEVRRG